MPMPADVTHGMQPPLSAHISTCGGGIETEVPCFNCPLWPGCNCLGGTVLPECPGRNPELRQPHLEKEGQI